MLPGAGHVNETHVHHLHIFSHFENFSNSFCHFLYLLVLEFIVLDNFMGHCSSASGYPSITQMEHIFRC